MTAWHSSNNSSHHTLNSTMESVTHPFHHGHDANASSEEFPSDENRHVEIQGHWYELPRRRNPPPTNHWMYRPWYDHHITSKAAPFPSNIRLGKVSYCGTALYRIYRPGFERLSADSCAPLQTNSRSHSDRSQLGSQGRYGVCLLGCEFIGDIGLGSWLAQALKVLVTSGAGAAFQPISTPACAGAGSDVMMLP